MAVGTRDSGAVFDLTSDGWGVTRGTNGQIIFIPGAWPGDHVEFEVVSEGKFVLAKLLHYVEKSSAHRPSPCPHSEALTQSCGTCPWIGINYPAQLQAKQTRIEKTLKQFSLLPHRLENIMPSPEELHYRNRIKLHSTGEQVGYQKPLSHEFRDVRSCPVIEKSLSEALQNLVEHPPKPGEHWLATRIAGIDLPAHHFRQGNDGQNKNIKEFLEKKLDASTASVGVELFCGSGNFSEILAKKSQQLFCFENDRTALEQLAQKHLANVTGVLVNLYGSDFFQIFTSKLTENKILPEKIEVLFLDPPRSGFRTLAPLIQRLPNLRSVFYLSCDLSTFCRDVKAVVDGKDFEICQLQPFDMFPQTPHIELMGVLHRSG